MTLHIRTTCRCGNHVVGITIPNFDQLDAKEQAIRVSEAVHTCVGELSRMECALPDYIVKQ